MVRGLSGLETGGWRADHAEGDRDHDADAHAQPTHTPTSCPDLVPEPLDGRIPKAGRWLLSWRTMTATLLHRRRPSAPGSPPPSASTRHPKPHADILGAIAGSGCLGI